MENVSTKINLYILSPYEYDINLLNYRAYRAYLTHPLCIWKYT